MSPAFPEICRDDLFRTLALLGRQGVIVDDKYQLRQRLGIAVLPGGRLQSKDRRGQAAVEEGEVLGVKIGNLLAGGIGHDHVNA